MTRRGEHRLESVPTWRDDASPEPTRTVGDQPTGHTPLGAPGDASNRPQGTADSDDPGADWSLPTDVLTISSGQPAGLLARTSRGWTVVSPGPARSVDETSGGLLEGMVLGDLLIEELGVSTTPDRAARRGARRGAAEAAPTAESELDQLRRTVSQLQHALATRVNIERAIGVLAERHRLPLVDAFELLRRRSRDSRRGVADLAQEVLRELPDQPSHVDGAAELPWVKACRTSNDPG